MEHQWLLNQIRRCSYIWVMCVHIWSHFYVSKWVSEVPKCSIECIVSEQVNLDNMFLADWCVYAYEHFSVCANERVSERGGTQYCSILSVCFLFCVNEWGMECTILSVCACVCVCVCVWERERERERGRDRQRERQTEGETDRQRWRDREWEKGVYWAILVAMY